MGADEDLLLRKIRELSPQRLAELKDYVDFLLWREDELRLTQSAAMIAEGSLAAVWNNAEDAVYDDM